MGSPSAAVGHSEEMIAHKKWAKATGFFLLKRLCLRKKELSGAGGSSTSTYLRQQHSSDLHLSYLLTLLLELPTNIFAQPRNK